MFALMNKYNPSIFFGVPTLFSAMLNDEALKNERGGSRLRICTSAGEALPESVGNAWKSRFGVDILDGVGSTELLHIFLSNSPGDIKYGTSGRPVPGYQSAAGERSRRMTCADGEVGEMLVHAPSAGEGYWNQRSKTRSDLRGLLDPHRRQIYSRRRWPLHLLRPKRRHVQGVRHLGVAVRGRERADHPSRGAGSRRGARGRSGRTC